MVLLVATSPVSPSPCLSPCLTHYKYMGIYSAHRPHKSILFGSSGEFPACGLAIIGRVLACPRLYQKPDVNRRSAALSSCRGLWDTRSCVNMILVAQHTFITFIMQSRYIVMGLHRWTPGWRCRKEGKADESTL